MFNQGIYHQSTKMTGGFVGGSGTLNSVAKWTPDGVTIGNSIIQDNGTQVWINSTDPGAQLAVSTSALPTFRNGIRANAVASNGIGVYGIGTYGVSGYTATTPYGVGVYGNASSLPYTGYGGTFIGGYCALEAKSSTSDATSVILSLQNSTSGQKMIVLGNGNVGIGTSAPSASTLLDLSSTTGALLLTRLTTVQKTALTPLNGMVVYDTDLGKFQGYEAGAWVNLV